MTALRTCPRCKETKPASGFYRHLVRPGGLSHYCRVCSRLLDRVVRASRRESGLCACGNERVPGYLSCRRCLARVRRATRSRPWKVGGPGRPPG